MRKNNKFQFYLQLFLQKPKSMKKTTNNRGRKTITKITNARSIKEKQTSLWVNHRCGFAAKLRRQQQQHLNLRKVKWKFSFHLCFDIWVIEMTLMDLKYYFFPENLRFSHEQPKNCEGSFLNNF